LFRTRIARLGFEEVAVMKRTLAAVVAALAIVATSTCASAQAFPVAKPAEVGMSGERLERLRAAMRKAIDEGTVAGIVTLVLRQGKAVAFDAYGQRDREKQAPMKTDAVFRIASQTKAITSVAIMMLYEEGRLLLTDPVSKHIPEFKETKVAVPLPAELGGPSRYTLVPAKRAITLRDLLTHTSGYSYGNGPAAEEYKAARLQGWFFADREEPIGHWIRRLAALPLDSQPGERYIYGYSTDILGHVVERASGMSLADFFEKRIFAPLKMKDTHFFLPPEKLDRLTAVYGVKEGGGLELKDAPETSPYVRGPRACYAGGAGLVATITDYGRFLEMVRRGGELDGARLLSPKSVELMTVNHVADKYGDGGFGLGFGINTNLGLRGNLESVGAFGWGGAYHTNYWADPKEELSALVFTQLLPAGDSDLHGKFKALVYQAIVDSATWRAGH
jgi:CubicO group peptidase (beta-lactamase class C family)